jgi:hypothetical protein
MRNHAANISEISGRSRSVDRFRHAKMSHSQENSISHSRIPTMKLIRSMALMAILLVTPAAMPAAEVRMPLRGQLFALANEIKLAVKMDPRIQGQPVAMGAFTPQGKKVKATNFGLRIENELRQLLSKELNDEAKVTLAGSYHFVDSESADNPGAAVLVVTAQLQNDRGRELTSFSREVNDTDDIRGALGVTGAGTTSPKVKFEERNAQLQQDVENPQFEMVAGDRVAAAGMPNWSVRILKKAAHDGPTSVVIPQNIKGLAYAPITISEYYEIELFNSDVSDAVAVVTIDGLDVANTFSSDQTSEGKPIVWPGYFVPRASDKKPGRMLIRGWLHTLHPTAKKDNVYSFLVNELGQGAASAREHRGEIGVITVQYFEACPPGQKLSGRSFGETAQGEGLEEKYSTKQVLIGDNALSTVSIRYNVPQE